ncbi:MAG: cadmium-translocating P-type ATPase [Peptococcaceae bacterium]|nr:cadmium-translocating P-type ATPase [Peptococcaceae bacterium]
MEARRKDLEKEDLSTNPLKKVLLLQGLGCSNCAAKIEKDVRGLHEVITANLDFVTGKMNIEAENIEKLTIVLEEIPRIISKYETGVAIREFETDKDTSKVNQHTNPKDQEANLSTGRFHGYIDFIRQLSIRKKLSFVLGIVLFVAALLVNFKPWTELAFFLISYFLIGGEVIYKALRNIRTGQVFDENFLMFIATVGAFAIREFPEAVAVMLFYQVGEFFQDMAVERSRKSISDLMDIRPDYANFLEGALARKVSPEDVQVGQNILIKPGEKIPLDGTVITGKSVLDTSALTGEFLPREVGAGSDVLAGYINKTGLLTVRVSKRYDQSTVSKILDLVENASAHKAATENFITKFARYYTPGVVLGAVLLAVLPPIFVSGQGFSEWLNRALVFLVVSCPCALVISIPLSFFGGIGGASRSGILIKGSNYLEALYKVKTMVFDKTGTLTEGVFEVTKVCSLTGESEEKILEYAALVESFSNHPIAVSIQKSFGKEIDQSSITQYQEVSGCGVKALIHGKEVRAGNSRMMEGEGITFPESQEIGTVVYISVDRQATGLILISDRIRSDAQKALRELREAGIKKIVMLTGDKKAVGEEIGNQLGFDEIYAELLPNQKVRILEQLEKDKSPGTKIAFIGDGINDAPVLARADVGIAMGGLGSDAAIEAADIVLMTDEPSKISSTVKIAKKTRSIVWQNIFLALGIKAVVLLLGAIGIATMWEAVFADVGVALLAILNAMRVLKAAK